MIAEFICFLGGIVVGALVIALTKSAAAEAAPTGARPPEDQL